MLGVGLGLWGGASPDPWWLGGVHAGDDGFVFDPVSGIYKIAGADKTLGTFFDTYSSDADARVIVDGSGLVSPRAANTPYLVYDKDGNVEGLDCRPQFQNLVTQPLTFDNAYWTTPAATVSANAAAGPGGATDADLLTESGTAAWQYIGPAANFSLAKNGTYAVSCFFKPNGRDRLILQLNAFSGNYFNCLFDATTGGYTKAAGGNGSAGTAYMIELPNGWWFCSITGTPDTANAATGFQMTINLANDAGAGYYTGDGTSGAYLWGSCLAPVQAGLGSGAMKFTTGAQPTAAETRAILDVSAAPWFDATKGTFLVVGKGHNVYKSSPLLTLWGGDFNFRSIVSDGNGSSFAANFFVEDLNVQQISLSNGTPNTDPALTAVAFRYQSGNWGISANGATPATSASGTFPTPSEIIFGGQYSAAEAASQASLNGSIKKVLYWPGYAATNDELKRLSAAG